LLGYSSMPVEDVIRACAETNDGAAWEEFVARFERAISLCVFRVAQAWGKVPNQVVDDLVQETYLKLCADKCRLLLEFAVQHPEAAPGYIKTIAINVARDHFKSLHSQKRGAGETNQWVADVEPQAQSGSFGGQGAMEREILLQEINRSLEACAAGPDRERDCLIFWLYYEQGISAKAIAALPGVGLTSKGVEAVIFRLTRQLRQHIVGFRSQDGATPPSEKGFRPAESY
jgi:RNA polymerase sigma-70 factor (ECF subfamily)